MICFAFLPFVCVWDRNRTRITFLEVRWCLIPLILIRLSWYEMIEDGFSPPSKTIPPCNLYIQRGRFLFLSHLGYSSLLMYSNDNTNYWAHTLFMWMYVIHGTHFQLAFIWISTKCLFSPCFQFFFFCCHINSIPTINLWALVFILKAVNCFYILYWFGLVLMQVRGRSLGTPQKAMLRILTDKKPVLHSG